MAEENEIQKAITRLNASRTNYSKTDRYYDGEQDLKFATEKFKNTFGPLFREFALNLCPAVVDALRDKLVIEGFRVEAGDSSISDAAWKIWQANRMGKRSGEIHKEAIRNGDSYAIVWVDANQKVTIYSNRAMNCTVFYDDESPGKILWGAKCWKTADKKVRLNLFYPDRIERYTTKEKSEADKLPAASDFERVDKDIPNPYGVVPIFHFANNADIGSVGRSELADVIPIQDGLNKSILDMLVAMEFASYRQRWAAGIEIEFDDNGKPIPPFQAGVERLWITESNDAKFGDFAATELKQFLEVKDSFRSDFATVSGTPLYYFMQSGANFPQSGESYRRSETRFVRKVRDRQEAFGNVWEDVMAFAMRVEQKGTEVRLYTEWEDPGKLTEKEELENLMLKQALGVTDEQLLTEAGYGAAEVKKMLAANEEKALQNAKRFNAGEIDDAAEPPNVDA